MKNKWTVHGNGILSYHDTREQAIGAALIQVEKNGWVHERILDDEEEIVWARPDRCFPIWVACPEDRGHSTGT